MKAFLAVVLFFILLHLGLSRLILPHIPYRGVFSFPEVLASLGLPRFVSGFANFDGAQYLKIAGEGYSQFQQAFFPLYPASIAILSRVFGGNRFLAAELISCLSFLFGLLFLYRYARALRVPPRGARRAVAFLILFPTSFFFIASYTESLFLLFSVLFFLSVEEKKYVRAGVFGVLASVTRFAGVFLLAAFAVRILADRKFRAAGVGAFFKKTPLAIVSFLGPVAGLCGYMVYLWHAYGDPLLFYRAQSAFGAGRSTHFVLLPQVLFRYLKILISARPGVGYFVAVCELVVFVFVSVVLILEFRDSRKNAGRLSLLAFSALNILVPTLTGTLLSVPRFALLSLSVFVRMSEIKPYRARAAAAVLFAALHVVLFSLFVCGYFVA